MNFPVIFEAKKQLSESVKLIVQELVEVWVYSVGGHIDVPKNKVYQNVRKSYYVINRTDSLFFNISIFYYSTAISLFVTLSL